MILIFDQDGTLYSRRSSLFLEEHLAPGTRREP
jgi:hypothetical protein